MLEKKSLTSSCLHYVSYSTTCYYRRTVDSAILHRDGLDKGYHRILSLHYPEIVPTVTRLPDFQILVDNYHDDRGHDCCHQAKHGRSQCSVLLFDHGNDALFDPFVFRRAR